MGKSILLQALCRALAAENLGTMVVTAWTGVAAAPFRAPTLCTLLGINFARLGHKPHHTEQQLGQIREKFATYFGNPYNLVVFVINVVLNVTFSVV